MKYTILLDADLYRHYKFCPDSNNSREGVALVSSIIRVAKKIFPTCYTPESSPSQLVDNETFRYTPPDSTSRRTATKIYFSTIEDLQVKLQKLFESAPKHDFHLLFMCVPRASNAESVLFVGHNPKPKTKAPKLPINLDKLPEEVDYWFKTKVSVKKLEEYLFSTYTKDDVSVEEVEAGFILSFGEELKLFCESKSYTGGRTIELNKMELRNGDTVRTLIRQNLAFYDCDLRDQRSTPALSIISRVATDFNLPI